MVGAMEGGLQHFHRSMGGGMAIFLYMILQFAQLGIVAPSVAKDVALIDSI